MSDAEIAAGGDRFAGLGELRAEHLAMLSRQSTPDGRPVMLATAEVQAFLRRAQATGAVISDPEERGIAQRVIDYWCAELLAAGREQFGAAEAETITLDPPTTTEAAAEPAPSAIPHTGDEALQYIRLSALARQWRDSNDAAGYLLTGAALEDARRFETDRDIARLIRASDAAERRGRKRIIAVMTAVIVALLGLLVFSIVQWNKAYDEQKNAENEQKKAEVERDIANKVSQETLKLANERQGALDRAEALAASRDEQRKAAEQRLTELQGRQQLLDSAVAVIAGLTAAGDISPDDLPEALREEMLASVQRGGPYSTSIGGPTYDALGSQGFPEPVSAAPEPPLWPTDPAAPDRGASVVAGVTDFAGAESEPGDGLADGAFEPDELSPAIPPIGSGPMSGDRPPDTAGQAAAEPAVAGIQGPFVAFQDSWLGEDALRPGLGESLRGTAFADGELVSYLHYGVVMDEGRRLAIYAAANLDRTLRNVLPAGGAPLGTDPRLKGVEPDPEWYDDDDIRPGRLVDRDDIAWGPAGGDALRVDAMVNALANTVPVTPAMQASWDAVSEWLRSRHNPNASRVVILGGPVFAEDAEPGEAPSALWKIALSRPDTSYGQGPASGALVVDAFLVEDDMEAADPERFRTTVAEIAARTGLVFSPEVLAADALATAVAGRADASHADLEQELQAAPGEDAAETAAVAAALVEQVKGIRSLPPERQAGLVSLLSLVPASAWNEPDWRGLKADARRGVAGLDATVIADAGMQVKFDHLKDALGLSAQPSQTVYLQFDQISREAAGQLRDSLAALGWRLPPAERVGTAAGLRQVRYNPGNAEDEAAAQLLAADIEALGWTGTRAIPVRIIKPGVLEIWLGPASRY